MFINSVLMYEDDQVSRWRDEDPEDGVPELLTVAETAEIMRCHKNTVYAQVRLYFATGGKEGIAATKIGGRIHVIRRQLEEKLQFKIRNVPRPKKSNTPGNGEPHLEDPTTTPARETASGVEQSRSLRAGRAPVGYLGRFVAQWRIRR